MKRSAQSAMEYLMTYGWAIIVILVVLAALYLLGIFTPGGTLGNQCHVQFKYSCTGFTLATNGSASFLLGQNTGNNQYNIAIACTAVTNSTGGPLPSGAWVYLNASGAPKQSYNSGSAYELDSGTSIQVNDTPCYSSTGAVLGGQQYGTQYTGILWLRYTVGPGIPGSAGNPYVMVRLADLSVAVGRAGSGSGTTTSGTSTSTTSTTTIAGTYLTGGNSGGFPLSASLSGTFTSYICAAGGDASMIPSVADDVNDSWGPNVSVLWHSTSTCSITKNPTIASKYITLTAALATVGLSGAPAPIINNKPLWPGETGGVGSINYTISNPDSFVIITASCGYGWGCSGYAFPAGCTVHQTITDSNGDTAEIAICQSQAVGKYYANFSSTSQSASCLSCKVGLEYPLGSVLGASMAAYVYPNYAPSGS